MAGMIDRQDPVSIQQAEQQVAALDSARDQLRGSQKDALRQLFDYDKALSERYSSPDSKFFIEHAGARERAISGFSEVATGEITNLFDLMEDVRRTRESLQKTIESLRKKSGTGTMSPSSFLQLLSLEEDIPTPPQRVLEFAQENPEYKVYYAQQSNGDYHYSVEKPDSVPEGFTQWYPQGEGPGDQLLQMFGMDREVIAKLSALEAINPKMAQKTMDSIMSSSVKASTPREPQDLTKDEIEAGVASTDPIDVRNAKIKQRIDQQNDPVFNATRAKEVGYTRDQYEKLVRDKNNGIIPTEVMTAINQVYGEDTNVVGRAAGKFYDFLTQ